ncbi:hypothetical protein [Planctomicrobium sp. SH527]|uniref:hypothetical protein n=1 Tax=Planctomicrobium sp. SH527 TaxID=3448123 RepID=UPI003F5AED6A
MSSPFSIFRRYEKILMVVLTGLAMVTFVLMGSVQDPSSLPPSMLVLIIAATLGAVAWLAGLSKGKGAEWGLSGILVGVIIGMATLVFNRPASAVLIDNGNLTSEQVSELRRQRSIANQFVLLAFQNSFGMDLRGMPAAVQRQYLFGSTAGENIDINDIVLSELLRREADQMGMTISNKVVTEFLGQVSSKQRLQDSVRRVESQLDQRERFILPFYIQQVKERPLTGEAFTAIRQQMRVSESELLEAIRSELKAVQTFELLYGRNELAPESFWEFYRQMNVQQTADIAVVPVADFEAADAKPSENELQELFNKYRDNTPGFTSEGRVEEGRPGFFQPRRFKVGYLEAAYDNIETLVGEISEEDVKKRYEEKYLRNVPKTDAPGTETPAMPATEKPATEAPAGEKAAPAAEMKTESKDAPKAEPAKEEKPAAEKAPEKADAPKAEEKKEEPKSEEAPKSEQPASLMSVPASRKLAFFDAAEAKADATPAAKPESKPEEKPAEKPAAEEGKPAAEKPAETKPAEEKKPATDKPAEEKKPTEEKPATPAMPAPELPPAPTSDIPALDDKLKEEIRAEIRRERTVAEIQKRTEAAHQFMLDLGLRVGRDESDKTTVTEEQAQKELEAYAAENGLTYVVTPMVSYQDLTQSDDYAIGNAILKTDPRLNVAIQLYQTAPTAFYKATQANNFNNRSGYAFWKLADKEQYVPAKIDDEPIVREQVIEAWKKLQAQPKAKARAEEVAKMVKESDKPMAEALAETTVSGKEGSLYLTVRSTGEFTWMQRPIVPPTGLQQTPPVSPSMVPGVDNPSEAFFKTVFDEMKVGDVRVIPNQDQTEYFVVKVTTRYPSTPEDLEKFREAFMAAGMQQSYISLAQRTLSENSVDWRSDLFKKHEVVIYDTQVESDF